MNEMLIGFLVVAAYLLPTIVAASRGHRHQGAIFLLNLLLGWTALGWLVALIWAAMDQRVSIAEERERYEAEGGTRGRLILLALIALPLVLGWWLL
jgi:hypothetical protein